MAKQKVEDNFYEMLMLVRRDGTLLKFASPELKNNYDLVLEAVKQNAGAYEFASDRLKADINIVKATVANFAPALETVLEEFRDNEEVVLTAIENNDDIHFSPLQYASPRLKNDETVVTTAIKDTGLAYSSASDRLKLDKNLALEALETYNVTVAVPAEIRDDEEVKQALQNETAKGEQKNKELHAQKAFEKDVKRMQASVFGRYLNGMEPKLANDPKVILTALKTNWHAIQDVPDKFKTVPAIAPYFGMFNTLNALRNKKLKLNDINTAFLANQDFAYDVYDVIADRVYDKYFEAKEQATSKEQLKEVEQQLHKYLNLTKSKIDDMASIPYMMSKIKKSFDVSPEQKLESETTEQK